MTINDEVLVRSFPSEPLIRKIFSENGKTILVWKGKGSMPMPCHKNNVYIVNLDLVGKIEAEIIQYGDYSPKLDELWKHAEPYYDK